MVASVWASEIADPVLLEFAAQTLARRTRTGDRKALKSLVLGTGRANRREDAVMGLALLPLPVLSETLIAVSRLAPEAAELLGAVVDSRRDHDEVVTPPDPEPELPPSPVDERRRLIGMLLDHDASEVFEKLEQLLDMAPGVGEALLLEMASRRMDLRGAIALLRDRVERDTLKGWIQTAVPDELERLVYLAMI